MTTTGVTHYVTAIIDACSNTRGHAPHRRQPTWPRQDGKPHEYRWLWCLGQYEQERQNHRVTIAVTDDVEEMVGEGLTIVGSAYREPREPAACGECREPEDFDWHPTLIVDDGPVIVCFRHHSLAPGWAYEGAMQVGLLAFENEPVLHVHEAAVTEREPRSIVDRPGTGRVEQFCRCGRYRYRVDSGPWTTWEKWDDRDGPNPALAGS